MINEINIVNYRCYRNSTIKGFKKVNLIGGLNNSGKTILLEAILLNVSPTFQNIATLKQLRGEDMKGTNVPEYAWDNFFYQQEKDKKIEIIANYFQNNKNEKVNLTITCNEKTADFSSSDNSDDSEGLLINDFITNEKNVKSVLHLDYETNDNKSSVLTVVAHQKGYNAKQLSADPRAIANFISTYSRRRPADLAKDYGIAEKRNKEKTVLAALNIIDSRIEAIRVSVVGGAHLEIKRQGENFMSSNLFGDAINKILYIVLTLVNNNGSILLIDEIENGIHHTAQKDFWGFIFQLVNSEEFDIHFAESNIQIFATTHSLEMMEAFVEASKDKYEEDAAYFELFKRKKTGQIEFNLHKTDTLAYEIKNNLAIRGE